VKIFCKQFTPPLVIAIDPNIVNQLTKIVMKIDDKLQAFLLLSPLLDSWDTLVVTLNNLVLDGKVLIDVVSDSLLNETSKWK